ncbi:MAG: ABC transporter permease [Bellilinea sp.]|jgi:ABC-2 type transport system permease protein
MKKTWTVLKHEFETLVFNRSFILTTILVPLVGFIILFVVGRMQQNVPSPDITQIFPPETQMETKGIVDFSGIIREIPAELQSSVKIFSSQDAALQSLQAGEIGAFYSIPADYIESGDVEYFAPVLNVIGDSNNTYPLEWIIQYNLFNDQPELLARIVQPLNLKAEIIAEQPQRDQNNPLAFFIPYGITLFFYIFILGSASIMLSNITNEKQNRVMEILLTSLTPTQMMTGKIIALGLAGLTQMVIWLTAAFFMLQMSGNIFAIAQGFELPPIILVWGVIYFILGYAIYASLMAGIGALVPNLREASQASFVVIVPLIIPLVFISLLIDRPDAALSIGLSFFPLTSPVAMMTRIAATTVPLWQLLLAALLQALTAALIIRIVAGLFRAQNLLSGQSFSWKLFYQALTGRA